MNTPNFYYKSIQSKLMNDRFNDHLNASEELRINCLNYTEEQWQKIFGLADSENIGIATIFSWGFTQGIYDFDTILIGELTTSDIEGVNSHTALLDLLPQQSIYIKLSGVAGGSIEFWATRMGSILYIIQNHDNADPSVHRLDLSGPITFTQAIEKYRVEMEERWSGEQHSRLRSVDLSYRLLLMIKSILYLCTENKDITEEFDDSEILRNFKPVAAEPVFSDGNWRLNPANISRTWKVGESIRERIIEECMVSISHWHQTHTGSYQWLFGKESKGEHFDGDAEELSPVDVSNRPRPTPAQIAAFEEDYYVGRPGAPDLG